jgi:hypothetical protein
MLNRKKNVLTNGQMRPEEVLLKHDGEFRPRWAHGVTLGDWEVKFLAVDANSPAVRTFEQPHAFE